MERITFVRVSDSRIININEITEIKTYNMLAFKDDLKFSDDEDLKIPFKIIMNRYGGIIFETSDAERCSLVFEEVLNTIERELALGTRIIDLRPILRIDGAFQTNLDLDILKNAKIIDEKELEMLKNSEK